MILSKTPLRISFFGGSSDHPEFIKKYKKSMVINFTSNLYTYVFIFNDKMGHNTLNKEYLLNYSSREKVKKVSKIRNVLIRECLNFNKIPPVSIYLYSDIFAIGSGLGASSSYILNMLKSINQFKGQKKIKQNQLIRDALFVERKFNKFCGYQDPAGCEIPGFKL